MNRINLMTSQILRKIAKNHVKCRNYQVSLLCSADDEIFKPSQFLMDISFDAIKHAMNINLEDISARIKDTPLFPNIFPGEHYKLLAGFVKALQPKLIVEIGTAQGLSALCMKKYLLPNSKLVTFDIKPWASFKDTYLKEADNIIQYVADLSDYSNVIKYKDLLESADMIFIDAGKDGVMEYKFMENFKKINLKDNTILIFDDIRLWNMLNFWRDIKYPKLDLTSFGHWTGTGIVQWRTNDTKTI